MHTTIPTLSVPNLFCDKFNAFRSACNIPCLKGICQNPVEVRASKEEEGKWKDYIQVSFLRVKLSI